MKTFMKFILSLLVGITLIVVGVSMGGLNELSHIFPDLHHIHFNFDDQLKNQSITCSSLIQSFDIDIHNAHIQFKEYDGHHIQIDAQNVNDSFTMNESKGEIVIKQSQIINLSSHNMPTITIHVPHHYQAQLIDVDAGIGYVKMSDIKAHTLDVDQGAGVFELNNAYVNELIVDTGLSVSNIRNLNCVNKMDIDVGMSVMNIKMINNLDNYDRKVDVGFGSVKINHEKYAGFSSNHHQNNYNNKCIEVNCGFSAVDIKGGF